MRSEGTPRKDGSERERDFLDMRRSFRTRGRVGRCSQGLHPGLVCVAPLGRVGRIDWPHCAAMGRKGVRVQLLDTSQDLNLSISNLFPLPLTRSPMSPPLWR
jgi:hypothetical protein